MILLALNTSVDIYFRLLHKVVHDTLAGSCVDHMATVSHKHFHKTQPSGNTESVALSDQGKFGVNFNFEYQPLRYLYFFSLSVRVNEKKCMHCLEKPSSSECE